jgi:hypothetical protein
MRSFTSVPSAALNLQLSEEVLYDLPPLEGAFLYWHTHGATSTTPGIASLLARREQMLGVTTLAGASIRLLCTGVGTGSLTRWHLRDIAAALALPFRTLKRCTINSSAHASVEAFAMQPGMVSPFLHPQRAVPLSALVLLPWRERWDAQEREVAISLSLWESLVLPVRCLRPLIRLYARRAYPQVRFIELGGEGALESIVEADDGS